VAGGRWIYDWAAVRDFYEDGHTVRECRERFGFSNGAWHRAIRRGDISPRSQPEARPPGATRQAVAELLAEGLSQAAIAARLDVSRPTVCFHMRHLGIPAQPQLGRRFNWNEIRAWYEAGHSMRECLRTFGFSRTAWADAINRGAIVPRPRLEPLADVLAAGRRRNRSHVKRRLLIAGLKQERCESCGLTSWRERPVPFELHHINGNGHDNRLENLMLLCPNCHSQTDTWGARNKGAVGCGRAPRA
jgi:DNA-binding CsgD family transcriptional regulator